MKRYKVIRDCVGFQRRMWREGTIIELEDNETPPHHFQLMIDAVAKAKPVNDPMRPKVVKFTSLAASMKTETPKTGMAVGLTHTEDATVKRGAKKASTKGSGE